MNKIKYPKINIRSKNELSKQISSKDFTQPEALSLINDVIENYKRYWKDNTSMSESLKGKFVRSAWGTPLGKLLHKINNRVLSPQDKFLPGFIYGGVKGKNHVLAAKYLLGDRRKRTLLKMDITRFFEQVSDKRVFDLFFYRFGCSKKVSKILADLCCVSVGPKGDDNKKTIARGFATSPRLAIWCNLDIFLRIHYLVQKELKNKDARLAIYVDDIGITASKVSDYKMKYLSEEIEKILANSDRNQSLPINKDKTKIIPHNEGLNHLGLVLYRNKLDIGIKTRNKKNKLNKKIKESISFNERKSLINRRKSISNYQRYIRGV